MNWKVVVNINNNTQKRVIFIKHVDTIEKAYTEAKRYFLLTKPEIDFCGVESAIKI